MSLMSKVQTDNLNDVNNEERDSLGGKSFTIPTDIYPFEIKYAYVIESANGALGMSLHLQTADGQELRLNGPMGSIYFTNRNKEPFYVVKQGENEGQKNFLPGYQLLNALTNFTIEQNLLDIETEEKTINLYDPNESKEVPTSVDMVVELIGQQFYGAVTEIEEDRKQKDDKGNYVPTGETRRKNELIKVFNADKQTMTELQAGDDVPEEELFYSKWLEKNKGEVIDRVEKTGATSGAPAKAGKPTPAKKASAPQKKLFGN